MYAGSGTGGVSKSVEFLEKLQTAFDPPIFGKSSCKSFIQFRAQKNLFKGPKSTMYIFGLKITPPPPFGAFFF